jgi:UDP-2,3-diacylglucosamine pyrophosphatase LpxH
MDAFDYLAIVSDLHLGGPPGHQIFRSGDLLAKGIQDLNGLKGRVGLVLNGDVVDFLAEDDAATFDPTGAPRRLARIIDDPAFAMVFQELARFCLTGDRVLVVVLGNHDVEMAFAEVHEVLLRRLSSTNEKSWRDDPVLDEVRGRVRFATRGYGYRCLVNGKSVYCFHGDISDGWNAVDHSGIARTQHDMLRNLVRRTPMIAPGTELVVNHLNRVKRELPFSDLLKPEIDVGAVLVGVLRPDFARRLPNIIGLATRASMRAVRGTEYLDSVGDLTALEGRGSLPSASSLALSSEAALDRDPLDLLDGSGDGTLFWRETGLDWVRRHVKARIDKDWSWKTPDEPMQWVEKNQIDADLVVAGHTHMRKLVQRPSTGSWYVNSGTWIDLIRLEKNQVNDADAFAELCKRLDTRNVDDLRNAPALVRARPTWVYVEPIAGGAAVRLQDAIGSAGAVDDEMAPSEATTL